jgi:acyl-CoA synthetase (AMP-forming)/AMP-acid ligase II
MAVSILAAVSEIVDRFARIASEQPGRIVIYASGTHEAITASTLWQAHLELSRRLTAVGLGPNQLLMSVAGNRPASLSLLLACLALRVTLMPVDAGSTQQEITEYAARFRPSAIVLPEAFAAAYSGTSTPLIDDLHILRPSVGGADYQQAALLRLTSGSTGLPKATVTTEAHLIADGQRIMTAMGIRADDVQIATIPLSHAYGFGSLVMPLLLEGTAIVLFESFVPQQSLLDARRFQARVFPGVPYMFKYFATHPPEDGWPSCLKVLISAGAPLDAQTKEAFHRQFATKIHSFYGTSETGGIAYDASDEASPASIDGNVGTPMPGVAITMRPDAGAPPGSGRILVHSTSVATGYLDTQVEEEYPFIDGGFLTGDYGAIDNSGDLTLTGRASPAVNVAGRKVQPAEVERVLRSMTGIDDVCVIAAPDERRGQQIVACVASRQSLSALEVRRFCAASLAPYKIPRAIIFFEVLPMTPRGKTDHAKLLAHALDQLKDGI